jgi:hypothetical protein
MRCGSKIEQAVAPGEDVGSADRDLFEMANLYPDTTGLPMTVWVSPRGNARHDVRVKVNMAHGNQMNIANTAVVGVRPTPHRRTTITRRHTGRVPVGRAGYGRAGRMLGRQIDTARMIQRLKPLSPTRQAGQPATSKGGWQHLVCLGVSRPFATGACRFARHL